MARQPTAIAFTRSQEKFGKHILEKTQAEIEYLEQTIPDMDDPTEELEDLYDDEYYWTRFVKHMQEQRAHLRARFIEE